MRGGSIGGSLRHRVAVGYSQIVQFRLAKLTASGDPRRWHEAGTIHSQWMMTRINEAIGAVIVLLGTAALTVSAVQTQNSFALGRFTQQIAAYMMIRHD